MTEKLTPLIAPLLAIVISSCSPSRDHEFTIIYSNDVRGEVEPCG